MTDYSSMKKKKFKKFTKIWTVIYIISFAAFQHIIIKANVLPIKLLVTIDTILVLLSILLCIQLFSKHVKIWAKVFATVLSTILIVAYTFGTVYGHKTLSFLEKVSRTDNKKAVEITEKPFNIYITGMDTYGTIDMKGRSDVNMIVTVNPKTRKILLTSIPRDYEINLKKHDNAIDKLTHTGFYGVDDTLTSVEDLLDIKLNYYIKVNFTTVDKFIDAIGGITVYSDYEFKTGNYGHGEKPVHIVKGENKLDGPSALSFARERHAFKDGDNQRVKNQQKVFQAVIENGLKNKKVIMKYTKVLDALQPYFRMNISSDEIRALVKLQLQYNLDDKHWTIEKNYLEGHDSFKNTYSGSNAYVMSPDKESIANAKKKIKDVMNPPKKGKNKSNKNSDSEAEEPAD